MKQPVKTIAAMLLACAFALCIAACGANRGETANSPSGGSPDNVAGETGGGQQVNSGDNNPSDDSSGNSASEHLNEIDVILDWYPNAVHAFIYDAIEKGYYAEEGLRVNICFPSNENDALSLTAAGKAEVGIYYMQDVITTRTNQGVPVKAIAAITQKPLNIILSLKEKDITSPADLDGKLIGYAGTELSAAITKYLIEHAGVTYDEDNLINVGFDLMASMTTGRVDATIGCMVNHEVPQMEEEGFEVNYFNLDDYGIPTYYELIFLANDDMIENDPETLRAFLRASKRGFEDMKADPEGVLQILLDNQNAENFPLSKSVETKSMEILLPAMETENAPFLSQSEEVWRENIDWLFDQGLIGEKKAIGEFMTDELMPRE